VRRWACSRATTAARSGDSGFEFRGHALLQDAPDVRRLDLHASLRDPFGGWLVRLHSLRKADPGGAGGRPVGVDGLRGGAAQARGAGRLHREPGLVGLAHRRQLRLRRLRRALRRDLWLPQTRAPWRRPGWRSACAALQPCRAARRAALHEAHRQLPRQRALVFLVSDFHLPLAELAGCSTAWPRMNVVPVVLWQPLEFALGARHGLAQVREPESGQRRWLWWRPALRERWLAAQHGSARGAAARPFRRRRLAPLFIEGAFDADAVTRHFMA
jgi:hypothetical protein